MAHWRPRVNTAQPAMPGTMDGTGTASPPEDSYAAKLVKYIPAECIAAYQTVSGYFSDANGTFLAGFVAFLVVCTPLWILGATKDERGWAWYQALVAFVAFIVWLIALDSSFIGWALSGFQGAPHPSGLSGPERSTILVGATIAFPLIEKLLTKFGVKV
jgi:hypothetical protein